MTSAEPPADANKLERMFGPQIWDEFKGKVVLDFGCGTGTDAIEIARHGAKQVIGLDIRQRLLAEATLAAEGAGVAKRCVFCQEADEKVDVIVSLDAFEHFSDPGAILKSMRRLLKDKGSVFIEFGPPWHHPRRAPLFGISRGHTCSFQKKPLFDGVRISKRTGRPALERWKAA